MQSIRLLCIKKEAYIELIDNKNIIYVLSFIPEHAPSKYADPIRFERVTRDMYDFIQVGAVYENLIDIAKSETEDE